MKNGLHTLRNRLAVAVAALVLTCLAAVACLFTPAIARAEDDPKTNAFRSMDNNELYEASADIMHGVKNNVSVARPEHGDEWYVTLSRGDEVIVQFAALVKDGGIEYHKLREVEGKLLVDNAKLPTTYFADLIDGLNAGVYDMAVRVPEFTAPASHSHWWAAGEAVTDGGVTFAEYEQTYVLEVKPYNIESNPIGSFEYSIVGGVGQSIDYNGTLNNTPELTVTFGDETLKAGVDYTATASTVNVGESDLIITGIGNFTGEIVVTGAFNIVMAENGWKEGGEPAVTEWRYGSFVNGESGFNATPKFLDSGKSVVFKVTYDDGASEIVEGLDEIVLTDDGLVSEDVAAALNKLNAGIYYVTAQVENTVNYTAVEPYTTRFEVGIADNAWDVTPYIMQWSFGGYDKEFNIIEAQARFTDADNSVRFTVSTDREGKNVVSGLYGFTAPNGVVSDETAEILGALNAGTYYLTSFVRGTNNYTALSPAAMRFEISVAKNYWDAAPSVEPWIVGEFDSAVNKVVATPHFGTANVVIRDTTYDQNIVYDPENGVDKLKDLAAGTYVITVTVAGTDNYSELEYSGVFRVSVPETELIKRGLPWWGTLIIVIGALGIAAAVLYILHRQGVLKMTSAKAIEEYKIDQTQKVVAAAIHASRVEAERKAAKEARERELEQEQANAAATAVDAEEIPDTAMALDAAVVNSDEVSENAAQPVEGDAEARPAQENADAEAAATAEQEPAPKKSTAKKSTGAASKSKSTSTKSASTKASGGTTKAKSTATKTAGDTTAKKSTSTASKAKSTSTKASSGTTKAKSTTAKKADKPAAGDTTTEADGEAKPKPAVKKPAAKNK